MTPLVLLVSAVIIGACCGLNSKIDQEFEDRENLVEPTKNSWIITNKFKEKTSLLKNLIIAFKKFDSNRRLSQKEKEKAHAFDPPMTGSVDENQTTRINGDNQDKTNDKDSANNHETVNCAETRCNLGLGLQNEENKKFIHSILGGWAF